MPKLLIATHNPGKFRELFGGLNDLGFELISLDDFPLLPAVEETGETFEENARIKSQGYGTATGLPAVADDGGLEIDVLNGAPGVKSRRWIDPNREATDKELVDYTMKMMAQVPRWERTARLTAVVSFYDGRGVYLARASVEGSIVEKPAREIEPGYPFRSLFFIEKFGKLYKDLTEVEHAEINHRMEALAQLKPVIAAKLI